jgi:predicted ATPase
MSSSSPKLAVSQFRLKNFKAIRDSGIVKFTPFTVFIGNNGVGKSSLIEGLEALQAVAQDDIVKAFEPWHGIGSILNQSRTPTIIQTDNGKEHLSNVIEFQLRGTGIVRNNKGINTRPFTTESSIALSPSQDQAFFLRERLVYYNGGRKISGVTRLWPEHINYDEISAKWNSPQQVNVIRGRSILFSEEALRQWQFVRLAPDKMSEPVQLIKLGGYLPLSSDGSNIAAYLDEIGVIDPTVIDGIVETVKALLPYVVDIKAVHTSDIGRYVYLQLTEKKIEIPGWLMSSGTLRLVALLALFRHPTPPPLIVIEEIENGLDTRTIALLVEEIRTLVTSGRSQVIVTTHSPYLLDLVPLSSIVYVERVNDEPKFFRPADDGRTQRWNESFTPGKLYTMGTLRGPN